MRNRAVSNSPRKATLGLAAALVLFAAGCGGGGGGSSSGNNGNGGNNTPPANPALATITGTVKDTSPSHNPVVGAHIAVAGTGRSAVTDSTGTFVVTNVPLSATAFTVATPDNSGAYYNYANYNGHLYDLTQCTLALPKLAAGANAPYTEVDMYIGGSNPPPPPPIGGCPS